MTLMVVGSTMVTKLSPRPLPPLVMTQSAPRKNLPESQIQGLLLVAGD
jgi:hypothetical protein